MAEKGKKSFGSDKNGAAEKKVTPYVSQNDVPSVSFNDALRVCSAIADNFACHPTRPLAVAEAMGLTPGSSWFRKLCGASIGYGLTTGGYNAPLISISQLGRRIVKAAQDDERHAAMREAILRPRVLRDFLTRYDGSKLPREDLAYSVLGDMGVPIDAAKRVFDLIVECGRQIGAIRTLKDSDWVDLHGFSPSAPLLEAKPSVSEDVEETLKGAGEVVRRLGEPAAPASKGPEPKFSNLENRKVFITHGKNRNLVGHLKQLLEFGQFEPVVCVENETVSKPVPDKVLDEMRSCGAAIIHIDAERKLFTADGEEVVVLNEDVLIEIGAAQALFGRRIILLVQAGVKLPSNLQGLYEVRYQGDRLDGDATLRLLKSFNDFRNYIPPMQRTLELSGNA